VGRNKAEMRRHLLKHDLQIVATKGDGNCFFRAFRYALQRHYDDEGTESRTGENSPATFKEARAVIVKWLGDNWIQYSQSINGIVEKKKEEEKQKWLNEMSQNGIWVEAAVFQAAADCYRVIIIVHTFRGSPMEVRARSHGLHAPTIHLLNPNDMHYDAVVPSKLQLRKTLI
jgi:hypothetical protein